VAVVKVNRQPSQPLRTLRKSALEGVVRWLIYRGSTSICEIYVEYKCYEGVTMLHNVSLPSNLIKVTVEKVLYGDIAVPVPTSEVTGVVKALHTFVV